MSIAELIMQGTEQNSKSTAWVSDSLQKLGQNVSAVLKEREQQKQAQAMMPFLQQSIQESMTLAGQGKSGDAYAKMLPLLTDPSTANNPYIMRVIPALQKGIEVAASDYQQNRRLDIAASRASGSGGEPTMPKGPSAFFNQSTPTTETNQPAGILKKPVDATVAAGLPVMEGGVATQRNPFEEKWSFTMSGYNPPSKNLEKKVKEDNKEFINSPPEKQQEFKDSVSSTVNPRGTEFIEAPGLSAFKGFEDISGIYIPKENYIQFPESLSLQEDEKGSKYTTKFVQKTVNQQQMDKANALAYTDLPLAIRRINDNQTLQRFFTENTPDKLDVGEKGMEDGKEFVGYIGVRGTDNYINLSKDDLIAVRTITGLPSTSKTLLSPLARAERPTAPKPSTEGIPAVQAGPVAPQIPEAAGNPFAAKLETIQKTETEADKKKTVQEVSRVIETVTRLEQTLAGLAKGEMPETIDYLPRAKKAALQGTDLEGLKKEFNILANLKPAIEWVRKNPNNPKAAQAAEAIRQQLGI